MLFHRQFVISLQKDLAIQCAIEVLHRNGCLTRQLAAKLKRARIPPSCGGYVHICGYTTYIAAVVPSHRLHNALGDDACASEFTCRRWSPGAPAHYDQASVITRKHKLTICPGVLVSLATSCVRCNNWYTLSSATPPISAIYGPTCARTSPVISPLDGTASTDAEIWRRCL